MAFGRGRHRSILPSNNGGPFDRSNNYRKRYFDKHKGILGLYTCAYCGKIIAKHNVQVDHIFPIGIVRRSAFAKGFIAFNNTIFNPLHPSEGVNGVWNTCSACSACNSAKSDSGGLWIWRGYIGRIVYPIVNLGTGIYFVYSIYKAFAGDLSCMLKVIIFFMIYRFIAFVLTRILK